MVARSGTSTCSRVPAALITSGVADTMALLPALSRVLNSTRVPAPKLLPTSSITWPTLAAACAALAATPLAALAMTCVSVAVGTAALSTLRSTL